jgi:hypothetical protein
VSKANQRFTKIVPAPPLRPSCTGLLLAPNP